MEQNTPIFEVWQVVLLGIATALSFVLVGLVEFREWRRRK